MTKNKLETREILSKFKDYLYYEKSLSENTINSYLSDINLFLKYLDNKEINKNHTEEYLNNLSKVNYSENTKKRIFSSIKSFLNYAIEDNYISNFEIFNLKFKSSEELPDVLLVSEVEKLINFYNHESFLSSRNITIIDFMYSTGCRVSELCSLKISDIDLIEEFVRLQGKGSKQRIVPIGSKLLINLNKYLELRNSNPKIKSSYLFLSKNFKKIDRTAVFRLIKTTGLQVGINSKIYPHTLRHSAATHMLEGGCDLRTVQEFLGHSSVSTTQIYTKVTKDFLEEAFTESHPRSWNKCT